MNEEKQIILFFRGGLKLDAIEIASKIKKKFEELGEPTLIPFNPKTPAQPIVIFDKTNLNFTVNTNDISFVYNREDDKKYYDMMIEIIECFEDMDYSFERLGYVSTYLHTKKEKETFVSNVFKDSQMIESEFQLSWYKKELIDSVSVNVWEREMTDILNNIELVSVFDINTPMEEPYNITSDFVRDFLKQCDKYIMNKDKKYK